MVVGGCGKPSLISTQLGSQGSYRSEAFILIARSPLCAVTIYSESNHGSLPEFPRRRLLRSVNSPILQSKHVSFRRTRHLGSSLALPRFPEPGAKDEDESYEIIPSQLRVVISERLLDNTCLLCTFFAASVVPSSDIQSNSLMMRDSWTYHNANMYTVPLSYYAATACHETSRLRQAWPPKVLSYS